MLLDQQFNISQDLISHAIEQWHSTLTSVDAVVDALVTGLSLTSLACVTAANIL